MTFDEINPGTALCIDTNVLVYLWNRESPDWAECRHLLQRCNDEEIFGFISTTTVAEMLHRLMCEELKDRQPEITRPAKYLKKHWKKVRDLREYWASVEQLLKYQNLSILETEEKHIIDSQNLRDRYGLLTNDSIIVQVALDYGITAIATNDADFERIDELQVFQPSDA